MNFNQFRREVSIAVQGDTPAVLAGAERALHKKELSRCAQALNQFAAACLEVAEHGDRPRRIPMPAGLLPPVV